MELLIKVLVFLPLFSALIIGLRISSISDKAAQYLSSSLLIASALCSAYVLSQLFSGHDAVRVHVLRWFDSGDFRADWVLRVDMLTAVMLVVVTWVSSVVHLYSIGYMSHDPHKPRFMAYLSLFTFCMLMLVTSDNLVQLFFGWEGVGLSSYLLIGFWFKKETANAASMKAFIVNRVGDVGLALGIALLFFTLGTVQYDAIFESLGTLQNAYTVFLGTKFAMTDAIGLLLFIGCMGKSAQFLLHVWLPDAMEGPTPVSALIHAATMVTAGVFLLARFSPLFELAPVALSVITVVGGITALFAASVGLVQNDIKRVIAYSTCSQLGYMFFACGVGAYSAAVFHLFTHAFFKALLFLGAGSVIHAMSDEQDMRNMGGLYKKIPWTYAYMWLGSLALAGIPFFAGYYSKDLIIEAAYAANGSAARFAFWAGVCAAFFTAFYSGRLLFMTFHGQSRASKEVQSHIHESPAIMTYPLLLLAFGAVFAGYIGAKQLGMVDASGVFWQGSLLTGGKHGILEKAHHVPAWVIALPLIMAISGLLLSALFYIKFTAVPHKLAARFSPMYQFLLNKWYIDELYHAIFILPTLWLGRLFWKRGDGAVIDKGFVGGAAALAMLNARNVSKSQSGYLYHYAFLMIVGLLFFILWFSLSHDLFSKLAL
jgi:NADH-quinone oxidoreductase subunit L